VPFNLSTREPGPGSPLTRPRRRPSSGGGRHALMSWLPGNRLTRLALATAVGLSALITLGPIVAPAAGAATSTKYYSASASPSPIYVATPTVVTVTLTNSASSQQSFGSAELTIGTLPESAVTIGQTPAGWQAAFVGTGTPAVVKLTNPSGSPVAPGGSISLALTLTPLTAAPITIGTEVKQANDFSGSGNAFVLEGADPTITVMPLHLQFSQQPPSYLQQSDPKTGSYSYMCPPVQVELLNSSGGLVTATGVSVTISSGSGDPGLYFGTSPITSVTQATSGGYATFGTIDSSGACSSGLSATSVGSGFSLIASSPAATSTVSSSLFSVVQSLQICTSSCTANVQSASTGAAGVVDASNSGGSSFSLLSSFGLGETLSCSDLVAPTPADPLVATSGATAAVSGYITLTFPKAIVNSLVNNGTPLMPVCVGAEAAFPVSVSTTGSSQYPYQGLLYACGSSAYAAALSNSSYSLQICVESYAKIHGGAEQVVVYTSSLGGDPMYW
jgi:hypothetical protein